MHKWLPIINYFVSTKIIPTNLVFELIIQKNFYSQMRLLGLIKMHTKEFLIASHLCIGSIETLETMRILRQVFSRTGKHKMKNKVIEPVIEYETNK